MAGRHEAADCPETDWVAGRNEAPDCPETDWVAGRNEAPDRPETDSVAEVCHRDSVLDDSSGCEKLAVDW